MELLTRQSFGTLGPRGYPADTVLGRAQKTLQDYRKACESLGGHGPHTSALARPSRGVPRRR